jgi:hypothetical protein
MNPPASYDDHIKAVNEYQAHAIAEHDIALAAKQETNQSS